jgi:hypothetical protein
MSATKSREVIWGNRVKSAKADPEHARKRAVEAVLALSVRMEGYGGPAQPHPQSPNLPEWRLSMTCWSCDRCLWFLRGSSQAAI